MRLRSRDLFKTIHTEGGLLPADLLQRVADNDRSVGGLGPTDYHLGPNQRLTEAITRSWTRLTAAWRDLDAARAKLPPNDPASGLTRDRWLHPLFDELGYGRLLQQPAVQIEDKAYPVFSQWQNTPIHIVGAGVSIDARTHGVRGAAGQSPHSLVQELLNRSLERLWGMVSNGLALRLLRDNVSLTRQAYVQFDLEAMYSREVYSDFVLLWLVCHQSRVEADKPQDCWLERWTKTAADTGTRALDALRQGVEQAIQTLGAGFLACLENHELHAALQDGTLSGEDYYRTLLRLVYRLLFLFVAEDRGALLNPVGDPVAQHRYRDHYSTAQLRDLASKRRGGRHHDRYQQLKLIMSYLHEDGCEALALPALGSYLWDPAAIGPLATAQLANEDLFSALRSLTTVQTDDKLTRSVDFRNLGAEELGSVYESLLELHPRINRDTSDFKLDAVAGSERKTTGSYYTPSLLISSLLDTALEPVLEEAARAKDPEHALLALNVVDPACGSGHFLMAAANRIAKRLAAVRSDDSEPSPDAVRVALRDVVGHCIHGVDVNPMAVELCRVSLWMEALEPGQPLSFLDHRIVLGNSLLGTTPELIGAGIPAEAFKPILGDDKKVVSELRKRNAKELSGQLGFGMDANQVDEDARAIAAHAFSLAAVDDHSLDGVREQQRRFQGLLASTERQRAQLAADLWCAAFVARKQGGVTAITQDALNRALSDGPGSLSAEELGIVANARADYSFLHWHVAFPDVWQRGGFDVVLGNPPWERVKLQEKEFFAARSPDIANAPNKAARDRLIRALSENDPDLMVAFDSAKRVAEGASHLIRSSGRYPLCGRGDVNTYAVFAELMRNAICPLGRTGVIVPTGIATDDTTKFFFQDLIEHASLVSLFDFENRQPIFEGVHRSYKFSLMTLTGFDRPATDGAQFVFFAHQVQDLDDPEKRFTLTADDIALLNPNTRTCPVFRTRRDAEITKGIYGRVPVLIREGDPDGNPWGIKFSTMFHMSNDSHLFRTRAELEAKGYVLEGNVFVPESSGGADSAESTTGIDGRYLPLYEGRLGHQFNHRFATQPSGRLREVTDAELVSETFVPEPTYWVSATAVATVTSRRPGPHFGFLGFRRVARDSDERTIIATILPWGAVSYGWILSMGLEATRAAKLAAVYNSFAFDYGMRCKLSQPSIPQNTAEQCAAPPPEAVPDWVLSRVLELTYAATDLNSFASAIGYDGSPFRWDLGRPLSANVR